MVFCVGSLSCGVVVGVLSSCAIFLLRKRELVALVYSCYGCLCFVSFSQGSEDGLRSLIVSFPEHAYILVRESWCTKYWLKPLFHTGHESPN